MKRLLFAALAVLLTAATVSPVAAQSSEGINNGNSEPAGLEMYEVEIQAKDLQVLSDQGFDIQAVRDMDNGKLQLDIAMAPNEAAALKGKGKKVGLKRNIRNESVIEANTLEAENGYNVWRSWSEENGIRDEMLALADQYPHLLKLSTIGQSVNGQDILALKLTEDANRVKDGKRPAVVYISAQHAREWITVETNLRLLRYYLSNYNADPEITELIDTTELWFVLVANPDGYDFTFTEGNRLWRKNLADNNGDGEITANADGVDLNRNFTGKWGYDNEGSSDNPASQVYRGPAPNSEPETQAMDAFMASVDPVFMLNYHSAAELLLYGIGSQVATPSPDDNIMAALAGTDASPAVSGYDPDLSAELYITNGTTDDQAHGVYGIMMYTPELDTCESGEDIFPDDAFGDTYCEDEARSGFEFPDDEALIQAVFEKNLEFSLNMARSAGDPTNPVTNTGISPAQMVVDTFDVSYGSTQEVAVETQREYQNLRMHYTINDGREQTVRPSEWGGGERYGDNYNDWYAEYRGTVTGASAGDTVTVWFTARDVRDGGKGPVESEPFTYTVESASGDRVLIVANEDYTGFAPEQPGVTAPLYVDAYADALAANGVAYDTWDVTAQGVPHDLGVLSHYDLVIWELGDNRLSQEAEDVITDTPFGPLPDLQVAESQQALTIAIRDYLNEGGKLFHAGEYTGYYGFFGDALGGAYYGLNGDPTADCVITEGFFSDCLIFSNDFAQYYLGIWSRQTFNEPELAAGVSGSFTGTYAIDGAETPSSGAFTLTSEILPADEFPLFASVAGAQYATDGPGAFEPFSGDQYAAAQHADGSWMRLSQTVDLTAAASAEMAFKLSYNLEGGYDHVIVEARTAGGSDWTTLPDVNGGTSQQTPTQCEDAFFQAQHPDLANYFTVAQPCSPTGATGEWHSFTGDSGGWTDAAVDLSAYAGSEVEVSITYVTDPGSGGIGVFVDDVVLTIDGAAGAANGFEDGLGGFTVPGAPASSPGNGGDWITSTALFDPPAAVAVTEDTVTYGYGFEAIVGEEARAAAMAEVLAHLLP